MTVPCCSCDKPATVVVRVVPRRGAEPLTDDMRRATAWPGSASPCDVPSCGAPSCHDAIRASAVTILAMTAIETTEATA